MNWASAKMLVIGVVFLFLIQGCGGIPTPEIPKFNRQPHPELKYRKGSLEKELARDYDFFKKFVFTFIYIFCDYTLHLLIITCNSSRGYLLLSNIQILAILINLKNQKGDVNNVK